MVTGRDAAGAEADDEVAGRPDLPYQRGQLVRRTKRHDPAVSMGLQPRDQRIAVDALDRLLAGSVDIGDDDSAGVVEAVAELLDTPAYGAIAVPLHLGDDSALGRRARGPLQRAHPPRNMPVIV